MIFSENTIKQIRNAFPRASVDLNGRKRAFFDNGTGTLVLQKAAQAEYNARINSSANVDGVFDESQKANEIIFNGRLAIADFLNAPSYNNIVSGESATSLFFNLSYAIGKELTGKENIVTTEYEHYANVSPWEELGKRNKITNVRYGQLNKEDGTLNIDNLQELIDSKTKVVTITAASNMLGTKSPLEEISKLVHETDSYFIIDAVHHIAHGPMDVKSLNCDFLVFSGYKLFTGHGSYLYGKEDLLNQLQNYKVKPAHNYGPEKWEWGTRNQAMFAGIIGVFSHLHWLSNQVQSILENKFKQYTGKKKSLKIAMTAIEKYEKELSKTILTGYEDYPGLLDMPKVSIYGLTDLNRLNERDPTFSFTVDDVQNEKVVSRLWKEGGIAARAEHYYSYAQDIYNQPNIVRISLVHHNTLQEIGIFLKTLNVICNS